MAEYYNFTRMFLILLFESLLKYTRATISAYELWFKQILFEMDIVRKLLVANLWVNTALMTFILLKLLQITRHIYILIGLF